MRRWQFWSVASVLLFVAASYAFISFWAGADVGYDMRAEGRSILQFWGYSMLGLFAGAVVAAVIAVYVWVASRREIAANEKTGDTRV